MQHLSATGSRLIVKRMEIDKATESGIILHNPKELNPRAVVVSVGPKVKDQINIGDQIMIEWRRTAKLTHNDHVYYLVDESDVWAVFE